MQTIKDYYNDLIHKNTLEVFKDSKWVSEENDPSVIEFIKNNPLSKYYEGFNGVQYIGKTGLRFYGFWVETERGLGVTEFQRLKSEYDDIKSLCTIPPIYKKIDLISFYENHDNEYAGIANLFKCHKIVNDEIRYDLYISTDRRTISLIIENATTVEVAETEEIYNFCPNFNVPQKFNEANLELIHHYTKINSLKIQKEILPSKGEYSRFIHEIYDNKPFWEAEMQIAFWDEGDKYSLRYAVEAAIYQKYIECFNNICLKGEAEIDRQRCEKCIGETPILVNALISLKKIVYHEYDEDHLEYSDFFAHPILEKVVGEDDFYLKEFYQK